MKRYDRALGVLEGEDAQDVLRANLEAQYLRLSLMALVEGRSSPKELLETAEAVGASARILGSRSFPFTPNSSQTTTRPSTRNWRFATGCGTRSSSSSSGSWVRKTLPWRA